MIKQFHPCLGIYPEKTQILTGRDTHTPMFIAALFTIAKLWKQSKSPPIDQWINKMWYAYTKEYYSAIKVMKSCHLQQYGWPWRVL